MAQQSSMDVSQQDNMNLSEDEEGGTRIGDIYIPPPVQPYCSNKSIGPRLIITKILNKNFKSYAGEVWLGPFFHCFNAIIGPNGSGKSNVIDSMLFVFGYRANKIRCKKLSVLIHNSARFPQINSCQVTVFFAQIFDKSTNMNEYDIVDGSEFYISRTAFKDNSSYYTINEKRVMFKEVAKCLKDHNIDLNHNRFLILQGEVESISTMKPKGHTENECGHLEYLEDIIGTVRYKEPLLKINNRVDRLTEERTEKHNRCKLSQRDMDELQKPMENAVEYLKLENDLTRTRNLQIQKYLCEQNQRLKVLENDHEEVLNQIKEHDKQYDEIKKKKSEQESLIKEEIAQQEKLTKDHEDYEQELKTVFNKYNEIQASMDVINKRRKHIKQQLKKEQEDLEHFKNVPGKNANEIAECDAKIEKLQPQKTKLENQLEKNLEALQIQTKPLLEEKEQLDTQLIDLQANVDKCKGDLELAESELKICQNNEMKELRKYETLRNGHEDSKAMFEEKQVKLRGFNDMLPEMKKTLATKKIELQQNQQEEQKLISQLSTYRMEITEKMSTLQVQKSNNRVLNALMKQKFEGKIPGILGRLGDLGGIDSKYDVAISTGCGRLDNIVVDTVNTAQACVEYLKAHDVGRGTFIALEKISHLTAQATQRIQTPENVPRLFDLIRVEDRRVLPAFYFSLRDTLVADDLNQGTRISYGQQRYRVVTLRGEVIETSGTMSGGGNVQFRGKMGERVQTKTAHTDGNTSFTSSDLERMQIKAQQIQENINYLQEQQSALETEIQQLTNGIKVKENEIKRMTIDLQSLTVQLPRIAEQVKKQEEIMTRTKADPKQVQQLQLAINNKRTLYEKSQAAAQKIGNQVSDIVQKIGAIGGEKVKCIEKKINDLTKQITVLQKNVTKLNVEILTAARDVIKTETLIVNLSDEIKGAEAAIYKGNDDRTQADEKAVQLKEQISKTKKEITQIQQSSKETREKIAALQKEDGVGKIKRFEIEQNLQTVKKKIADVNDNIPHWRNKLKPLKLNSIPNESEQEPLKSYTDDELASHKLEDLQYKISVQEEKLKSQSPNLNVIQEYYRKREVYLERVQILEDITNKRNEMRQLYDDVRKKRYTEFMQGFSIISRKLKEMYQMITLGGDAELELVDSMDPFSEGVSFSVRPPKKSWKNITNLSGGEKTLSSLALVFALHYYKPSPLYFMDEIDAALDFRNVSIVANYIKARTKNAQFIIISLRSNMFELADYLTGIYKISDCTMSVTIPNDIPNECVTESNDRIEEIEEEQQQQPLQTVSSQLTTSSKVPANIVNQNDFSNEDNITEITHHQSPQSHQTTVVNAIQMETESGFDSLLNSSSA